MAIQDSNILGVTPLSWELIAYIRYISTSAGFNVVSDKSNAMQCFLQKEKQGKEAIAIAGVSSIYHFSGNRPGFRQLTNSGLAGTFAAGACSEFRGIGAMGGVFTQTAQTGSGANIIKTNRDIRRDIRGSKVLIVGGTGKGKEGYVTYNTIGPNAKIYCTWLDGSSVTIDTTTQYRIWSGSIWAFIPGTTAVGFGVLDWATGAWTPKSVTNLPTAFGTDGQLATTPSFNTIERVKVTAYNAGTKTVTCATPDGKVKKWVENDHVNKGRVLRIIKGTGAGQVTRITGTSGANLVLDTAYGVAVDTTSEGLIEQPFDIGTAQTASTTTLIKTGETLNLNQYNRYSVRFITGANAGESKEITATATNGDLTTAAFSTTPTVGDIFYIEGNDDRFYLLGNNAVTTYKYLESTNTWSTITPGTARGGAISTGGTFDWINEVPDALWQPTATGAPNPLTEDGLAFRQNGRYFLSARGNGSAVIDLFDAAAETWINDVMYGNRNEGISAAGCSVDKDGMIYFMEAATGGFTIFDTTLWEMRPFDIDPYPQSTTVVGDKMFILNWRDEDGGVTKNYLYHFNHTRSELRRIPLLNP